MHTARAAKIEKEMVGTMTAHPAKRVAVLLSSGVDSHACLFAALRAKKRVTTYSFTMQGHESTDFKVARQTAATFGLDFVPVEIPNDLASLKKYLVSTSAMGRELDIHVNKTSFECLFPLFTVLRKIVDDKQQATVVGFGGDAFFCMLRSQKKRLHEYETVKAEYLKNIVVEKRDVQGLMLTEWLRRHAPRHELVMPFHTVNMFKIFKNMHPFDPGCKPIQKAPVRLAFFDEFEQTNVLVHQNFQKGDSGISDHFSNLLLPSDWNTRNSKSVKGIYNDLELKRLPPSATLFSKR